MILHLDTSDRHNLIIRLEESGKQLLEKKLTGGAKNSSNLLQTLKDLFDEKGIPVEKLTGLRVNPGPGSYTSLRVGIAIANTLSYALKIPINDLPPRQPLLPEYGQAPYITPSPESG